MALVGPSGSGKSTAIALLEQFYGYSAGRIVSFSLVETLDFASYSITPEMYLQLIDDKDIKTYDLKDLREIMGLVGQEPKLYSGTKQKF